MNPTEKAVDVAGLAQILEVSAGTIYRKATDQAPAADEIPGFRVGRTWRFYPSVVKEHQSKARDPWAYSPASRAARRRAA